ncbi:hypothetical protein [Ohessyouella blattaphilus]|uniref:Uncharacterized protein n=1 Tax=Ohessyouella blattaphilus TaxID=2949333 RepID=A0ABT1EJQ7_9FIRM|nr:hypothetical protein [Ohessyouella blattaphilus]MCP1110923.1 hypothetical protein [Ohessyouella blattaphilus]MCR8564317.1 hypothetical protein [Ohessyouella blattaphilus]
MNNSKLYEKRMLFDGLNKIKHLRDAWEIEKPNHREVGILFRFGYDDYEEYQFIINESRAKSFDMLKGIILELLTIYKLSVQHVPIYCGSCRMVNSNGIEKPYFIRQDRDEGILAFVLKMNGKNVLYIFKEYGIKNYLPEEMVIELVKKYSADDYAYIAYAEDKAYSDQLNHNNDEKDHSRGTSVFSLKYFFEQVFGGEEYSIFSSYLKQYMDKVESYFGVRIVRSLVPNTLYSFKQIARARILAFDYKHSFEKGKMEISISDNLKKKIDSQFLEDSFFESILGDKSYALCFLTAEWLYSSLNEAENIDLTSIAMGYFKAIEQFLFLFISCQTKERKNKGKTIYNNRKDAHIELTDEFMNSEKEQISLGVMTGFLRFEGNKDLIKAEIREDVFILIRKLLNNVKLLRNGFFHKDNLLNWETVNEARDLAYLVLYFLLGAYTFDDNDKKTLGIPAKNIRSDYNELCKYINRRVAERDKLDEVPIFYITDNEGTKEAMLPCWDDLVTYDAYGNPVYSGIYFRNIGEKNTYNLVYDHNNLPKEIIEGTLRIVSPERIECIKSEKKVFEEGVFLL